MTELKIDHIEHADVMDYLRALPDSCVNLVVTSPPYFGLRDYGVDGQIGLEPTPAAYIARMVDVFREVRRVLVDDGNCYVNLGDSFSGSGKGRNADGSHQPGGKQGTNAGTVLGVLHKTVNNDLPDKSLMLIPHRFAIAMQDDGWLLREDIVWHKPNPMPESVTDRCTRAHEYIFHFTKQARYWYDQQAVSEESTGNMNGGRQRAALRGTFDYADSDFKTRHVGNGHNGLGKSAISDTRNRRSVWTINPASFREAHFATFPEDIPEICIKAACPEWCCEKCGAPYEAQVEKESNWEARKANGATGGAKTNGHNGTHGRGMSHDLGGGAVTHYGYAPSCTCNAGKRAGVVLDPFAGAGTTALVAKRLNRRYIGCDLNAEYVEMARRRVESIPYTLFSLMGAD